MRLLPVILIIMFAATGCMSPTVWHKQLDEAQRLIYSDPEAAFKKLDSIDVSQLNDSADMARWALLYSEAMAANRFYAPGDTIINIALDYYSAHNAIEELKRAKTASMLLAGNSESSREELICALYFTKEKEYFLAKERIRSERYLFAGIIVAILAIGVIMWQRARLRIKSARNEALLCEASELRWKIQCGLSDMSKLETTLNRLLDNRFALIDSLCGTYYEARGTKAERNAIVSKVKNEIEAIQKDDMVFAEMQHIVNECRNGLLEKLSTEYPAIKDCDYRLAVYIACGLSARTISLLMDESVEVIYKRKSRLKGKITEAGLPSATEILSIF